MKIIKSIKTKWRSVLIVLTALIIVSIFVYSIYYLTTVYIQKDNAINKLQMERYELQNQKVVLENNIQDKNTEALDKNKKIQELENNITNLNNEINHLKNRTTNPPTATAPTNKVTKNIPKSNSIFDRISAEPQIKTSIVNALNSIKSVDYYQFSIINQQVGTIYGSSECGGWQNVTRDIHIGDCNGQDGDGILAAIIVHEATHVYNVYVKKIYSYQTKEQELPCYQAELSIAQKLNLPAYFLNWIQSQIDYWSSK